MKVGDFVYVLDGRDTPKPRLRQILQVNEGNYRYVAATVETIQTGNPFGMCFREEQLKLATEAEVRSYLPISA